MSALVAAGGWLLVALGRPMDSAADPCSSPTVALVIPAAVVSRTALSWSAAPRPFWGEYRAQGDLDIGNPLWRSWPTEAVDPWFKGKSEAMVIGTDSGGTTWYADGLSDKGFSSTPLPPESPNYYQPYKVLTPRNQRSLQGYSNTFWQHQALPWPPYDYATMKALAIRGHAPLYQSTPDGRLLDPLHPGGPPHYFGEIFNRAGSLDPDSVDPTVCPPLAFIDTVDGAPPRADGSNLATLHIAEAGPFFWGLFFVAANVYFGSAGYSPSYDFPVKPDDTVSTAGIRNCRLMGLLYSYGQVELAGAGDVYGALYAEKGFLGGGVWNVYYDAHLADPSRNILSCQLGFPSSAAYYVHENAGTIPVPVFLNCEDATTVTVQYRVSGGTATLDADFQVTTGTLTFAPGELQKSIEVTLLDDPIHEDTETVILTLFNACCASIVATPHFTLFLYDNDPPPDTYVVF